MYKRFDDLGLGVKSQSNLAMAGSCRNIPKYSLVCFANEVKLPIGCAELFCYGTLSNSELVSNKRTGNRAGG